MLKKICFLATSLFSTLVFGQDIVRTGHGDALRRGFDTMKLRLGWEDAQWYVECVFFDLNGDGVEEVLASPVNVKDRMGDVWHHWTQDPGGKYRRLREDTKFSFACMSSSFYKMHLRSRADVLLGLGMDAGMVADNRIDFKKKTPDCMFSIDKDGGQAISPIEPSLDAMFRLEDVVLIERLYSEWYYGFDFSPAQPDPHSPYTTWGGYSKPKGDLRRGGVEQPKGFGAFASEYRRDVKVRTGVKEKVTVYAVFLDADNDGDADCYVSSSAEGDGKGKYSWTLYLSGEGGYSKAKAAVHPVRDKNCKCELKPKATGRRDSFCRLVRFDVDPTFMLLDEETSPSAVRDAITNILSHRIEKLECTSFHE